MKHYVLKHCSHVGWCRECFVLFGCALIGTLCSEVGIVWYTLNCFCFGSGPFYGRVRGVHPINLNFSIHPLLSSAFSLLPFLPLLLSNSLFLLSHFLPFPLPLPPLFCSLPSTLLVLGSQSYIALWWPAGESSVRSFISSQHPLSTLHISAV